MSDLDRQVAEALGYEVDDEFIILHIKANNTSIEFSPSTNWGILMPIVVELFSKHMWHWRIVFADDLVEVHVYAPAHSIATYIGIGETLEIAFCKTIIEAHKK